MIENLKKGFLCTKYKPFPIEVTYAFLETLFKSFVYFPAFSLLTTEDPLEANLKNLAEHMSHNGAAHLSSKAAAKWHTYTLPDVELWFSVHSFLIL